MPAEAELQAAHRVVRGGRCDVVGTGFKAGRRLHGRVVPGAHIRRAEASRAGSRLDDQAGVLDLSFRGLRGGQLLHQCLQVGRRIQFADPAGDDGRFHRLAAGNPLRVGPLQLLQGFLRPVAGQELVGEGLPDTRIVCQRREFFQRRERFFHLADLHLPFRVLEIPAPGFHEETLLGGEFAQHAEQVHVVRPIAQRLVAQRDGVVEQAYLGVLLRGQRIVMDRAIRLADPVVQVANAVVEGKIELGLRIIEGVEHFLVGLDGGLPVLLLLVSPSLVLEFAD